jgi:ParB family chromosome partitioning protein
MPKQALGRGLDALINSGINRAATPFVNGASVSVAVTETSAVPARPAVAPAAPPHASRDGVVQLPIERIEPNPFQPRDAFDDAALAELAQSISQRGIVQPLLVRQGNNSHFELIAGERRWRAAKAAGLTTVPVLVREATDQEALELALIENLQREDLNPIEEALAYEQLAKQFHLTQEDIALKVGKSRAAVANAMRLLDLPEDLRAWVGSGQLSVGHAKVILGLASADQQAFVAGEVLCHSLTVRETEKAVERIKHAKGAHRRGKNGERTPEYAAVEEALQQKLATRVQIHPRKKGGTIAIEYYSADDLDRLVAALGVGEL